MPYWIVCNVFCVYSGALELFAELLQRFPNNVHLLTETAKVRDGIDNDANKITLELIFLLLGLTFYLKHEIILVVDEVFHHLFHLYRSKPLLGKMMRP